MPCGVILMIMTLPRGVDLSMPRRGNPMVMLFPGGVGRLANASRGDPNHDDFASGADLTIRMPIHNGYELSILP